MSAQSKSVVVKSSIAKAGQKTTMASCGKDEPLPKCTLLLHPETTSYKAWSTDFDNKQRDLISTNQWPTQEWTAPSSDVPLSKAIVLLFLQYFKMAVLCPIDMMKDEFQWEAEEVEVDTVPFFASEEAVYDWIDEREKEWKESVHEAAEPLEFSFLVSLMQRAQETVQKIMSNHLTEKYGSNDECDMPKLVSMVLHGMYGLMMVKGLILESPHIRKREMEFYMDLAVEHFMF